MARTLSMVGIIGLMTVGLTAGDTAGDRMFARLRSLAGDWAGTYEWSTGRSSGPLKATYYLTGNASALVENLIMGGEPNMTTIYHLDGADLRMTHYCAARNQPRLKASRLDETRGAVQFSFVDVTNVSSANRGYVEGFEMVFQDADHVTLAFTFGGGGARAVETIHLERRSSVSTPPR